VNNAPSGALPRAEYLATKQSFRAASGCLFRSPQGRVLLLATTYRRTWEVPGGAVEPGESPLTAARREVHEELGLRVGADDGLRLLCVDHQREKPEHPGTGPMLNFLFDGGFLSEDTAFSLQEGEILAVHWLDPADVLAAAGQRLGPRLVAAIQAAEDGVSVYMEDGQAPTAHGSRDEE
jgi:8-oxo-dGTP diphosphatase